MKLPVSPANNARPRSEPVCKVKPVTGKRILVVDDEQVILDLIYDVLTRDGHSVDAVGKGKEALEKIASEDYDLVITDLKMPGIGGAAIHEYVERNKPDLRDRIIFSTGDTLDPDTKAFFTETGYRHIAKPFKLATLRAVVRKTLSLNGP